MSRPSPTGSGSGLDADLAEGFARHVRQWALAAGAGVDQAALTAAAARALSLATSQGHVCLALVDLTDPAVRNDGAGATAAADAAAWRAALRASGVVGSPLAPGGRPLILDEGDRLYLHRDFDLERRLARRLLRSATAAPPADPAALAALAPTLGTLFDRQPGDGPDWQQLAAALALRQRLTLISGGPGTGKTTTVVKLLACLLTQSPDARVVLAAPTGKAAARLAQALRARATDLPPALRDRLPTEATTVHRLLGVRPLGSSGGSDADGGRFFHHAGHPLLLDALVVDEASMLDLALATRLLEAVPESARIILLGDKDQLSAVESGAVFAELSADPSLGDAARADLAALCGLPASSIVPPPPRQPGALPDSVVWFSRNYRFDAASGIGRLAADTVAGRVDAALAWLRAGGDASVQWLDDGGPAPASATLAALAQAYLPYVEALRLAQQAGAARDLPVLFEALARFQVLCAVREGPRGVNALNAWLAGRLRQALGDDAAARSPWFAGRPVMVLHNDPLLRLFNGDVGITLPDDDGALMVYFPAADGGFRALAPLRLPAHETALAMTVHKAQGSEFEAVAVLLPAQRSRVLVRELLYTAITRARSRVLLVAPAAVLAATLQTGSRRHSGLQARLAEQARAAEDLSP